jgi:hypothetical protein
MPAFIAKVIEEVAEGEHDGQAASRQESLPGAFALNQWSAPVWAH